MYEIKTIPFEATWKLRHEVMWPNMSIDYVKLSNDPEGQHFGLLVAEELVSIISVFIESDEAQFRKFATLKTHQGKGYGTALLSHVMTKLEAQKLKRIWCNARVDKATFYEKFGLMKTDDTFVKGGIDYMIMEK